MNTKQEIILRYYRENQSQRKISRDLGINRRTVKKYLKEYDSDKASIKQGSSLSGSILSPPKYNSSGRKRRKLTEEIREEVEKYLAKNKEKIANGKRKQVLKKIDIWEALRSSGFDIGYTTICNYIRAQSGKSETYIRQSYKAGVVCEFDWGEVKLTVGGIKRVYQLAVFTLAWSSYRFAVLYQRQDTQSFQQSHVAFFHHLGGVPQELVYDNMRVAVRRFVGRVAKEATNGLLSMSMYYQYGFRFCNAGKGNEKGHVERSVEYIRRKAFGHQDEFLDERLANAHLLKILAKLNAKIPYSKNQSAATLLKTEQEHFGICPAVAMECARWENFRVDKYATICVQTNHYSVPEIFIGKLVEVKVYADKLDIYYKGQALWSHQRRPTKFKWYLYLGHYLETLSRKPGALKGAQALEQASFDLKSIYIKYFKDQPRQFIELLHYQRAEALSLLQIQAAIDKLLRLGTREITLDKIKVSLENAPVKERIIPNGEIEQLAKAQLAQLAKLMNLN